MIFDVKSEVFKKFDEFKNDVANNKINSPDLFAKHMSNFILKTFNYTFFKIDFCIFKFEYFPYYYSDVSIYDYFKDCISDYEQYSKSNKQAKPNGPMSIKGKTFYVYTVPIWFIDDYLGFFNSCNSRKIISIFSEVS